MKNINKLIILTILLFLFIAVCVNMYSNIFGTLADWVGAVGNIGAGIIALYLANEGERSTNKRELDTKYVNNVHIIYQAISELGDKCNLMIMDMVIDDKMTEENIKHLDKFLIQTKNNWRLFILPKDILDNDGYMQYEENLNYLLEQIDSMRNIKKIDKWDNLRFGTRIDDNNGSIDSQLDKINNIIRSAEKNRFK